MDLGGPNVITRILRSRRGVRVRGIYDYGRKVIKDYRIHIAGFEHGRRRTGAKECEIFSRNWKRQGNSFPLGAPHLQGFSSFSLSLSHLFSTAHHIQLES